MSCSIVYNNFEKVGVLDFKKNTSKLFKEIFENVHISSFQEALDIYKNIYEEDIKNFIEANEEPVLVYKDDSENYKSYSDALRNTNSNEIMVGITTDKFIELFSISTNSSVDSQEGLINHLIKTEILSDKSYKENGKMNLIPEGSNEIKKKFNAEIVKDAFQKQLGINSARVKADGSVQLNEEGQRNKVTVTAKNGEQITVNMEELNGTFSELKAKFDPYTIVTSMASNAVMEEMNRATPKLDVEIVPENLLQEKIISLLKKCGIKTMAFEEYLKGYNKRNTLPITAAALADIANKVIAFKDGIVENDDLVEETSHLIVASIPEEQKANIKRNIHKTKEWMEYAKQYEGVYETEDDLREEILGKVVANSIKEKFAQRENNQTENSIIAKIKELFDNFIQEIRNYFQESYRAELDKINNDIYNNLFNETLSLDLEGKSGVFFNANEASIDSRKLAKVTQDALEYIRLQQNQLNKKYKDASDATYIEQSKRLLVEEEEAFIIDGVSKFARLVSAQTNRLVESMAKKKDGDFPLTSEENLIYQNLKNNVIGSISEINQMLNDKNLIHQKIKEDLSKTKSNLEKLQASVRGNTKPAIDRMVGEIMDRFDMTPKERNEYKSIIEASINGSIKDTDVVHTMLGSMLQANNGLLGLAGNITKRMTQQTTADFQQSWKSLVNKLSSLNWTNSDFKKIIDKDTNTIIHEQDLSKVKQWEDIEKAKIIKDTFKSLGITDFENLEDFLASDNDQAIKDLVQDSFYKIWGEVSLSRLEPYFDAEFIKKREEHVFEIAGKKVIISNEAGLREREYKKQIGEIRKRAEKGILTKEDNFKISEINERRAEEANPRDIVTGEFIKGVTEVYDQDKKRYFIDKDTTVILTEQEDLRASVVVGLNQISYKNQDFFKGDGDKEFPIKFLEELSKFSTIEEQLDFVRNNSYITYPDSFFEDIKSRDSFTDRLRDLETQEANDLIEDIRKQKSIIDNIKKSNSIKNKPGEIDVLTVTEVQKRSIAIAQSILENYYSEARGMLEDEEVEAFDAITKPTDSYLAHVEDMTLDEELAYIKSNTTPNGEDRIAQAKRMARGEARITKGFKNIFNEDMSLNERQNALLEYARTKLLPHLKKTEPRGYSEEYEKVLSGEISVSDWITGDSVKVTPAFGFYEANSNINPKWQANKDAGNEQWTEEYKNIVIDDRFEGIKNDSKLYEGWKAIMEYQDYQIENNNLTGVQSRYQAPFVRRTETQRLLSLTPQGISESLKEMIQFRPEEQELGTKLNNGLYTIPVYYNRPLDNPSEQTTDYLWAFAVYGQAATQHKYRRENISDMLILDDALSNVKERSKNAYKMFKSFLEYNFYGKQESFSYKIGGVDIGKVLKTINNFAKKSNIATITVPLTSLAQSTIAKNMERVIGETIDSVSSNIGNSKFMKYASSSARESMGFESKSVPNVLGEAFGLYQIAHRYENSQLSKVGRLFVNASSKLHEMGNFPVIQRAMFGVIASYRYVDGKIMHFNRFRQKLEAEGFKGSIQEEWKKQPEFIDDFIGAIKNGILDLNNPDFIAKVTPKLTNIPQGKTIEEYLEDRKLDIGTRVLTFVNRIDSQIASDERSIMQRDARLNFFLSHLGWLTSAIVRKTKQRHFNLSEDGEPQEGNWRTAVNFVASIIKNPKEVSKIYGDLDFGQKKNLRRTMIELGYANALALLGLVLSQMTEDDDDPIFPLAMTDYFVNRVSVETISGTVGLPSSIMGVIDNPIMLATKLKAWAKVTDLAGDSEDQWKYIKSYSGYLRDFEKFSDLKTARQSYSYFQIEQKSLYDIYAPLTLLYSKNE